MMKNSGGKVIGTAGALALLIISANVDAYTECERTVGRYWVNFIQNSVWVCFMEGGCVYKTGAQLDDVQLNRMLSMASVALVAGKKLVVRYPEDGIVCSTETSSRGDIDGFWVQ